MATDESRNVSNKGLAPTDGTNLTSVFNAMQGLQSEMVQFAKDVKTILEEDRNNRKKQAEEELKKQEKQAEDQRKKEEKKRQDELKEEENKHRQYLNNIESSIEGTVKKVFSWGIKLFTDSYSKVQQAYLNNFSAITAKMNMTASDYTKMFQDTARSLRSGEWRGLNQQFDLNDFVTQLQTELSSGLRGSMAQDKAMYDLIAKKLVPSIDVNSRSFTLGYRKLGEDFTKMSVGLARLNNNLGKNMEYFETRLNTATDEQLMEFYLGNGGNMYPLQQLHQLGSNMVNAFGQGVWQLFFNSMTSSLNSPVANMPFLMAGYGTSSSLSSALSTSPESVQALGLDVIRQQVALGESVGFDRTAMAALAQAGLIFSPDSVLMMKQYLEEFETGSKEVNVLDSIKAWGDDLERLRKGEFASETEKFDKMINNSQLVVDSSTFIAEKIPTQIQQLIGIVASGIVSIVSAIVLNKNGGVYDIIKGLITGKEGSYSGLGKGLGTWGAGGASTALGKGLGVAGIAAGAIWATIEGMHSYDAILAEGGTKADAWTGGIKKGILGSDYSQRSLEYQLANTDVDVGEVFSTAGRGALVGGGAGMIASPVGGLIGTAIGGVSAGLTNLFTQLIEKGRIKEYVGLLKDVTDNTAKLKTSQTAYDNAITQSTEINELLNIVNDEELRTTEERNEALRVLKEHYPAYIGNIKDITEWTAKESDAIKANVELQLTNARTEYEKQSRASAKAMKEFSDKGMLSGGLNEDIVSDVLLSFDNLGNISTEKLRGLATKYGYSNVQSLVDDINKAVGTNINVADSGGRSYRAYGALFDNMQGKDWRRTQIRNYAQRQEDWLLSDAGASAIATMYEDEINALGSLATALSGYDEAYASERIKERLESLESLKEIIAHSPNEVKGAYPVGRDFGSFKYYADLIDTTVKEKGWKIAPMQFAVGTDYIPYDNYPALLHQGEIVLNANDAESYRQLAGKFAIQALANSFGNAKTEVIPVAIVSNIDNTLSVISADIKTIIGVLQSIEVRMPQGVQRNNLYNPYPEDYSSFKTGLTSLDDR